MDVSFESENLEISEPGKSKNGQGNVKKSQVVEKYINYDKFDTFSGFARKKSTMLLDDIWTISINCGSTQIIVVVPK